MSFINRGIRAFSKKDKKDTSSREEKLFKHPLEPKKRTESKLGSSDQLNPSSPSTTESKRTGAASSAPPPIDNSGPSAYPPVNSTDARMDIRPVRERGARSEDERRNIGRNGSDRRNSRGEERRENERQNGSRRESERRDAARRDPPAGREQPTYLPDRTSDPTIRSTERARAHPAQPSSYPPPYQLDSHYDPSFLSEEEQLRLAMAMSMEGTKGNESTQHIIAGTPQETSGGSRPSGLRNKKSDNMRPGIAAAINASRNSNSRGSFGGYTGPTSSSQANPRSVDLRASVDFKDFTKAQAIDKYDEIVTQCQQLGIMFTDDTFIPGPKLLYENGRSRQQDASDMLVVQHFGGGNQDLSWFRSNKILQRPDDLLIDCDNPVETIATMHMYSKAVGWTIFQEGGAVPEDISQGALGNCWWAGALSSICATRPEILKDLFIAPDDGNISPVGAYLVRLFDGGKWVHVILDDYFPCMKFQHGACLAFMGARRNQLFVPLLEKAFSKLKGNYESMEGGNPTDALRLFTGWPCVIQELRASDKQKQEEENSGKAANFDLQSRCPFIDEDMLWARMVSFTSAQLIMVGSCGNQVTRNEYISMGLSPSHCYCIEGAFTTSCGLRLVRLRNPWGTGLTWNGDFGEKSDLWTERLRAELQYNPNENGLFFMPLEDVRKYFMSITFGLYRPGWFVHTELLGDVRFGEPYWEFTVYSSTQALVSLFQMEEKFNPWIRDILLVVMKKEKGQYRYVATSNRGLSANELVDLVLQAGDYVAVPITFLNNPEGVPTDVSMGMYFSNSGYEIKRCPYNMYLKQKALVYFVKQNGKTRSMFRDSLQIHSCHQSGLVMVAENKSTIGSMKVEILFTDVFNMEFSRDMNLNPLGGGHEQMRCTDSVPPMHSQIIIVGTGRAGGFRDAYTSKFAQQPLYNDDIHYPILDDFHSPFFNG